MTNAKLIDSTVTLGTGAVRGTFDGTVHRFLGIPYAEAPTGERRFAMPVPVTSWLGYHDSTAYGATPQRKPFATVTTIPEPTIPGTDTLNVNVFTPDTSPDAPLPVMVWIHGGGYISGSAASPWYDGRSFCRDGVVMVSVSYRLGFDGFGWLPDRPSNRGLADVVLALEWVRDNVERFGGDPARVTIAGQSAGGGLVMTLLAIPEAWPLFARAIALSAVVPDIGMARAQSVTQQLASSLGVSPDFDGFNSLGEVEVVDGQNLREPGDTPPAPHDVLRSFATFGEELLFGPIAGLAPYETSLTEALSTGSSAKVPVLFGATRDELAGLVTGVAPLLEHTTPNEVATVMGLSDDDATRYLGATPISDSARVAGSLMSDMVVRGSIPAWASVLPQPTWAYDFAWDGTPSGMAEHCFDLPFAFDLLDVDGVERVLGPHPPQGIADVLHAGLVRFISGDEPGWETTGDSGTRALVITNEEHVDPEAYAAALLARRSRGAASRDR